MDSDTSKYIPEKANKHSTWHDISKEYFRNLAERLAKVVFRPKLVRPDPKKYRVDQKMFDQEDREIEREDYAKISVVQQFLKTLTEDDHRRRVHDRYGRSSTVPFPDSEIRGWLRPTKRFCY